MNEILSMNGALLPTTPHVTDWLRVELLYGACPSELCEHFWLLHATGDFFFKLLAIR